MRGVLSLSVSRHWTPANETPLPPVIVDDFSGALIQWVGGYAGQAVGSSVSPLIGWLT